MHHLFGTARAGWPGRTQTACSCMCWVHLAHRCMGPPALQFDVVHVNFGLHDLNGNGKSATAPSLCLCFLKGVRSTVYTFCLSFSCFACLPRLVPPHQHAVGQNSCFVWHCHGSRYGGPCRAVLRQPPQHFRHTQEVPTGEKWVTLRLASHDRLAFFSGLRSLHHLDAVSSASHERLESIRSLLPFHITKHCRSLQPVCTWLERCTLVTVIIRIHLFGRNYCLKFRNGAGFALPFGPLKSLLCFALPCVGSRPS